MNKWTKTSLVSASLIALAGCSYKNLGYLEDGTIRMRQPNVEELNSLYKNKKFRSILNLRGRNDKSEWYKNEQDFCNNRDIELKSIPLSRKRFPTQFQLEEMVSFFETAEKPVLMHCAGGADRTGFASFVYSLTILNKQFKEASKQLSFWRGHIGSNMSFDKILTQYENQSHMSFKEWIKSDYNPSSSFSQ